MMIVFFFILYIVLDSMVIGVIFRDLFNICIVRLFVGFLMIFMVIFGVIFWGENFVFLVFRMRWVFLVLY